MILIIFVGMASIMIFGDFNDYDLTSMSMVMMLVREMVQNLKISLRGVHGTQVSFLRQNFTSSQYMIMYFDVDDCLRMATRAVRPCSSLWAFDLLSADQQLLQILKTEIDRLKYGSS